MTRKNISNAISNISDRHIAEVMRFQEKQEEIKMKKTNRKESTWSKWKPATAVAALALFVCVSGVTALAATGHLRGFFSDVFGWDGTVVGIKYEQATDEIELSVTEVSNHLAIELAMVRPDRFPYSEFETFGIESYKIIDADNNLISEGNTTEMGDIVDGKVSITIPLNSLSNGNYKLIINQIVGNKKANQPLILSGTWECNFTK